MGVDRGRARRMPVGPTRKPHARPGCGTSACRSPLPNSKPRCRPRPRPIRLILDDVHELVEPEALHGIEIFIRNRPAGVRLVLSSRCDPPLSLPRLRLAGRLWELRAARLRFSLAEAATLLEDRGCISRPARWRCCTGEPGVGGRPSPCCPRHRRVRGP